MTWETDVQVSGVAFRLRRADGRRIVVLSLKAIGMVLCVLLPAAGVYAQAEEDLGTNREPAMVQQTCPVMVGNKLDPEIYTVYKDKKVYFCCLMCKATFGQSASLSERV